MHRGKARYSRFEDLSDVSLSRNRCRRVYLDQKPTKLGNLGAPQFVLHNMKNIFNNFLNKKVMRPPTNGYQHLLRDSRDAIFAHIAQLYALEENKSIKIAFNLKKASLNPSNIARTSPQHAISK